jgi:hypothetical protein
MGASDSSSLPVDGPAETYTNSLRFEEIQKAREDTFNLVAIPEHLCGSTFSRSAGHNRRADTSGDFTFMPRFDAK